MGFLLALICLLIFGSVILAMLASVAVPIIALVIVFGVFALYFGVYVYIYRDAKKQGMNAWLWTLITFLLQIPIGPIVYLIARHYNRNQTCPYCRQTIENHYSHCPHCGELLKDYCPQCGSTVEPDWQVCARCGRRL